MVEWVEACALCNSGGANSPVCRLPSHAHAQVSTPEESRKGQKVKPGQILSILVYMRVFFFPVFCVVNNVCSHNQEKILFLKIYSLVNLQTTYK